MVTFLIPFSLKVYTNFIEVLATQLYSLGIYRTSVLPLTSSALGCSSIQDASKNHRVFFVLVWAKYHVTIPNLLDTCSIKSAWIHADHSKTDFKDFKQMACDFLEFTL